VRHLEAWRAGEPVAAGRDLAVRLHALGIGVLTAPPAHTAADVTVVVPVRDRVPDLDRCLAALAAGPAAPRLVVVDDGSRDPAAVTAVAEAHGAYVVVRGTSGGPAAARNTGLRTVTTPLVAFVDSDVVVPAGWLEGLLPELLPEVAAVAPRVVGATGRGVVAWHERGRGPLDLGPVAGPVVPYGAVGHVPAAALLCRVADLGDGFDETLRVGEDVDLAWRLVAAGRLVRYQPAVVVTHAARTSWSAALRQRHGYGRSAALLDVRHPGSVAPAAASRWTLALLGGLAATGAAAGDRRSRPGARRRARPTLLAVGAVGAVTTSYAGFARQLHAELPDGPGRTEEAARLAARGIAANLASLAEGATRVWLPVLLPAGLRSRRARRLTVAVVALRLARTRSSPLQVAEDLAYGSGVWGGAVRHRRPRVLLPRVR
jgi:mycofactocin system glycosyltransferase